MRINDILVEFVTPQAVAQDPGLEREKDVDVIFFGKMPRDYAAETAWAALEEVLPAEYPAGSERAQEKVYEVNQNGGAVVTNKPLSVAKKLVATFTGYGIKSRIDGNLNEFAPSGDSGGSGNYFQALASAWYNGTFDTGSLEKGIKSQQDVERLLNRGIVCPDGKTRKLHIDYNANFDGVEIYSDDYYEYGDYDDTIDSRTGEKWGPYDHMEFSDEDLSESLTEFAADDGDSGGEDDALHKYAQMWWAGNEATQMQIEKVLARMGWEIGEDEGGYDNGGVFVVRAGDVNGNSYQSWAAEDLTEGLTEVDRRGFLKGLGAAAVAGAAGYKLGQDRAGDTSNPYTVDKLSSEDLNAIDTYLTWYTVVKSHGKPRTDGTMEYSDFGFEAAPVKALIKVYGKDFIFARLKKIQGRVSAMSDQELKREFNRFWTGPADTTKVVYIYKNLLPDYELNKESVQQGMAEGWKDLAVGGAMALGALGAGAQTMPDINVKQVELANKYYNVLIQRAKEDGRELDTRTLNVLKAKAQDAAAKKTQQSSQQQGFPSQGSERKVAKDAGQFESQGVAEGDLNELSTEKLAQYKTAAGADARKADASGDYARGDKRFKGINQATIKQFDNDLKKHGQQGVAEGADYHDMVARVKQLAGMGPLNTGYDPQKRVYKNVPTAVQPKKEQR